MKERPILFSAPMIRAILEGRKTQTRRVINPQPTQTERGYEWIGTRPKAKRATGAIFIWGNDAHDSMMQALTHKCKYGKVGDRLWVRETFGQLQDEDGGGYVYRANIQVDDEDDFIKQPWKPSIHMPRKASRITLDITDIRAERLFRISHNDAISEGIVVHRPVPGDGDPMPIIQFKHLWESINGQGSWEQNPFVWVITFKRL